MDHDVSSLAVYQNALFAGGAFTFAGNVSALYIASWTGVAGIFTPVTQAHVSVYPNPFSDAVTIQVSATGPIQKGHIELYSEIGQKISDQPCSGSMFEIQRNNLPQGIYFFRVFSGPDLICDGKLIAQ